MIWKQSYDAKNTFHVYITMQNLQKNQLQIDATMQNLQKNYIT
jgi:hypothetical protein